MWESDILPLLLTRPGMRPVMLLDEMQRRHPERDWDRLRRTLERRVRAWGAEHGAAREVIFRQDHPPGQQGLSDFTDMAELGIRIAGEPLAHRLYHFVLAYSTWEHAEVVLGGESYTALACGLQNALWSLGGAPAEHRSDSLSAAFRNLERDVVEDQTRRYEALCAHYGMQPTRNNRGSRTRTARSRASTVTSSVPLLKPCCCAAALTSTASSSIAIGSPTSLAAAMPGARSWSRWERAELGRLPPRRTSDHDEVSVRVTSSSGFILRKVFYTVPSRLIGYRLNLRIYDDRLECFVGQSLVLRLPRRRAPSDGRRIQVVDYRHIIHSLRCKPMALLHLVYRDALFPRPAYRAAWERLLDACDARVACRTMVELLALAHERGCEADLAAALSQQLLENGMPDLAILRARFAPSIACLPVVAVNLPSIASYDVLLPAMAATAGAATP